MQSGRKLSTFWRNVVVSSSEGEAAGSPKKFVNIKVQWILFLVLLSKWEELCKNKKGIFTYNSSVTNYAKNK